MLKTARDNPLVSPKPTARVRFRTFGDSSLDFELLCWAHSPRDKGRIIHELNREIYKLFDREGICNPLPTERSPCPSAELRALSA